ncbi:MAG: hypothetical protein ACR2HS_03345 [Gammaproteobacteria bacterium]
MLKELQIINNIDNLKILINKNTTLVQATNKQQFKLLNNKISLVIKQIFSLNLTINQDHYLSKLSELYNYLNKVLTFINKFIVVGYKLLLLKTTNYSVEFQLFNRSLQDIIQLFDLQIANIFNQEEDERALLEDLADHQILLSKYQGLLVNLLLQQINDLNNIADLNFHAVRSKFLFYKDLPKEWQRLLRDSRWDQISDQDCYQILEKLSYSKFSYDLLIPEFKQQLSKFTVIYRAIFIDEDAQFVDLQDCWNNNPNVRRSWLKINLTLPTEQRCFLRYKELAKELQDYMLLASNYNSQELLAKEWDTNNNQQCDTWLKTLPNLQDWSTLSAALPSLDVPSVINSYYYLNEEFKQQVSQASHSIREILAFANQQASLAPERYWHECQDIHVAWFNYCFYPNLVPDSQGSSQSLLLFSSLSQSIDSIIGSQQYSCSEIKITDRVKVLAEQEDFKLLLLKITAFDPYETMQYIVGLPTAKADLCIAKNHLVTELDFDQKDIINLFDTEEEIPDKELQASKDYFKKYFVADLTFLQSLPNKRPRHG